MHRQLHRQVVGPRGEQLDQTRGGVFGEGAGRRDAQQPTAVRSFGDLDGGLLLQAQDLDGTAGQPQAAGVNANPAVVRLNNWSSSSLRSAATCSDTPASVMPSSSAAARTDPSRTTAE